MCKSYWLSALLSFLGFALAASPAPAAPHGGGGHGGYHGGYHGGHYGGHYYGRGYYPGIGIGFYGGPFYGGGYGYGYGYAPYMYNPIVVPPVAINGGAPPLGYPGAPPLGQPPQGQPLPLQPVPDQPAPGGAAAAHIRVIVPDPQAVVLFDGRKTSATGTTRQFHTPALTPGGNHSYRIGVIWTEGGQERKLERIVPATPGQSIVVDFTRSTSESLQAPTP